MTTRTVINDTEHVPELAAFLERRRAARQDIYDETWEGTYHVAPAPTGRHGALAAQLAVILNTQLSAAGGRLLVTTAVNIGESDHDYRVPDLAVLDAGDLRTWNPTAYLVVEVVSPGDESYEKFAFYAARGVEEVVIADPESRQVGWFHRTGTDYAPSGESDVLGCPVADVTGAIVWP